MTTTTDVRYAEVEYEEEVSLWTGMQLESLPAPRTDENAFQLPIAFGVDVVARGALQTESTARTLRTVPSAGGLYPYEIVLLTPAKDDAWEARVLDLAIMQSTNAPVDRQSLIGRALPRNAVHLAVFQRPWISERKYGSRGLLYSSLDAAHLTASLVIRAIGDGRRAEMMLGVSPDVVTALDAAAAGRVPHSTVSVELPDSERSKADMQWRFVTGVKPFTIDAIESSLGRSRLAFAGSPYQPTRDIVHREMIQVTHESLIPAPSLSKLASASMRRRSAASFDNTTIHADALWAVVNAAAARLPVRQHLRPAELRATLLVRNVSGIDAGSIPLYKGGAPRRFELPSSDVSRACMNQAHLANAAAFIVLHSRRELLCRRGGFAELTSQAGVVGHLIYLGAANAGIGVTAVGGFESRRWAFLAGVPASDDVVYLIALGMPTAKLSSERKDRMQIAYAHGE